MFVLAKPWLTTYVHVVGIKCDSPDMITYGLLGLLGESGLEGRYGATCYAKVLSFMKDVLSCALL